ncbi:MAG: hypothetical protein LUH42_03020, partial [Oscillospiraceae bacterium]|nr:hypothetical protein [Oscillospiraceae bacterium]
GGAVIDDTSVSGMVFDSEGDYFSAIYAASGEISITDSTFTAFGKGGDDFSGFGIVAVAAGTANLTIDNCVFVTGGALRSAIWSGGSSTVTVTNTVIQSYNDEDLVPYTTEDNYAVSMMQQVPFALGLTGNIRATLVCGSGNGIYTNCLVASNAWAVLSTDSGSGTLTATDVTAVLGVIEEAQEGAEYDTTATISDVEYGITLGRVGEMSGYIAYCDGFSDYVYGGDWYAPDYLIIITGGSVTVGASDNSRFYGWSDRIGFMSHGTTVNTVLDISEADFDVTDTCFMIKAGGGIGESVKLTDVTVSLTGDSAWSGSLLSVIDTDDLGGGPGATTFVIPYSDYETYLASPTSGEGGETVLNITDSDLTGDVYDSVGSMNGDSFKADSITVNLVNSSLTGVVSSAYAAHCDEDGTLLTGDMTVDSYGRDGTYDYLSIGRIINFAAPTVSNPVSISLENSAWVCTGLSYVASLTIDDASVVDGDVYQDGELIELTAGTYENVVVVPAGADYAQAVADGVTAIETAIAEGITPEDHSDLVANTDMGGMGSSGEASGEASK